MDNLEFEHILKAKEKSLSCKIKDPVSEIIFQFEVFNRVSLGRAQSSLYKESDTISWIRSFEPDSIFYDIGANVGVFSLFAGAISKAKVYAFEPLASNYYALINNINKNKLADSITAFCMALSDNNEFTKLHIPNLNIGFSGSSVGTPMNYKLQPTEMPFSQGILSLSLDKMIDEWGLPVPNHVKIDVDGVEHKIIKGAKSLLSNKNLKSILVEINPNRREHQELPEILLYNGFKYDEVETNAKRVKEDRNNKGEANYIFYRL